MAAEPLYERSDFKKVKRNKKLKRALKLAYITGWVDKQSNILRPNKQVKKILKKLTA